MRSTEEILGDMNPELRKQAEEAIADMKTVSVALSSIPSPSAIAGEPLDRDDDFLDERYGDSDED